MRHTKTLLAVLLLSVWCTDEAFSSKILALFPYIGKSHFLVFEPYLKGLSAKGHAVTVVSHFPQATKLPFYTDISVTDSLNLFEPVGGFTFDDVKMLHSYVTSMFLGYVGSNVCKQVLEHEELQKLIRSEDTYDVVITELFTTDCFGVFADKFNAPHISFSSSVLMPWANDRIGNPDNPSYIPHQFSSYSGKMNLFQRMENTVTLVFHKLVYLLASDLPSNYFAGQHFNRSLPWLSQIASNTSLILVNSHFSLIQARPMVPSMIEVGGIHIKHEKTLSKDLKQFLDESEHGVIYFSMGSMLRGTSFPEEKMKALLAAFSELPQRILWKWEDDSIPGQPKNVRVSKWMPQLEILGHPKVRLFMSHGGLLGTTEAAYSGVPMVVIPMFGDQFHNAKAVEAKGMAIILEFSRITKDNALHALNSVLNIPSYQENAKRVSSAFRDRPLPPLENAIYWTEYVIKHKGAPELRAESADLAWYQLMLLDVALAYIVIGYVVYRASRKLLSLVCKGCASSEKKAKTN